jgi:hypothetical protein
MAVVYTITKQQNVLIYCVGAIVGIVLSTNGRHSSQRGMAIAGTVLSIIGLIVSTAAWIIYTVHNLGML